jgi:hypothetical protein
MRLNNSVDGFIVIVFHGSTLDYLEKVITNRNTIASHNESNKNKMEFVQIKAKKDCCFYLNVSFTYSAVVAKNL